MEENAMFEIDFNECKSGTVAEDKARELLIQYVWNLLVEANAGDEYPFSQVAGNKLSVCVGTRKDGTGADREVCVEVTFQAKPCETRVRPKLKPLDYYDRMSEEKAYAEKVEEAETKRKEKARKKADNIAKVKARNEELAKMKK